MEHPEILIHALVFPIALIADRIFGEPRHHPLVAFGNFASQIEKKFNNQQSIMRGTLAALLVVAPPLIIIAAIQTLIAGNTIATLIFNSLILYFVIGWQSMKQHARNIEKPLRENDVKSARTQLALIVSRDTDQMDVQKITSSTIESVLENSNDCLFASIIWFGMLGPAGAVAHRLINTLDAMWGYKTSRYEKFGKFAARLDDFLGYLPARFLAIIFVIVGQTRTAITCWRNQAWQHPSPNGGIVMSTGAGAIECIIGGPAIYNGQLVDKLRLGHGHPATVDHIAVAIKLVEKSVWLLIGFILIVTAIASFIS